MVPFLF